MQARPTSTVDRPFPRLGPPPNPYVRRIVAETALQSSGLRRLWAMSGNAAAKWLFLAAVGAVDLTWMNLFGFRFGAAGFLPCAGGAAVLAVIALIYFYTERDDRIMEFAHFGAQFLLLSLVTVALEYMAVATDFPLADRAFAAIDNAMGLDWVAWAHWVVAHPAVHAVLSLAYVSLWFQLLLTFIYNVHTRASHRNSELWWITAFASLPTIAGGALAPALSAWVYHGLATIGDFPHMQQFAALRAGTLHAIDLGNTQGLIQLPSFHTVLAVMLAYNFRHHRRLFPAAVVLDALVILACPTEGGHYFVDLVAGAILAAAAILLARAWERRLDRPRAALRFAAA
jgi:hypothetical protein